MESIEFIRKLNSDNLIDKFETRKLVSQGCFKEYSGRIANWR